MATTTDDLAFERRVHAADTYRPAKVRLLLVAEAPPCTTDRYFYFTDLKEADSLFRYVYAGVTGKTPTRDDKAAHLDELKSRGVYLIDVCEQPIADGARTRIAPADIESVVARAVAVRPDAVILIKSNVYDLTFERLRAAGLNVVDARMPFPASGQQRKFEAAFAAALAQAAVVKS